MKGLNSLQYALKGARVKVESSDVKLAPVDSTARKVVMPCPWWAKPIPEAKTTTPAELQEEIRQLRGALTHTRGWVADKDEKILRLKEALKAQAKDLQIAHAQVAELTEYVRKLTGT